MSNRYPCANSQCTATVPQAGMYCPDCKRKEAAEHEKDWKHAGWTRQEEREELKHNKVNK